MRRRREHTAIGGAGFLAGLGLAGGSHSVYVFLAGVGVGALVVAVAFVGWRIGRRLVRRMDRALPDADRPRDLARYAINSEAARLRAISDDPDYLAGIERGMRSALRSAGHEDGRIIGLDQLAGRDTP